MGNGAFFAGFQKTLKDFLALEAFAAAVFLDNHVRNFVDAFVGSEAPRAFQALATAANGVAGAAFAGVDYLVIQMCAERGTSLEGFSPDIGTFIVRHWRQESNEDISDQRPEIRKIGFAEEENSRVSLRSG